MSWRTAKSLGAPPSSIAIIGDTLSVEQSDGGQRVVELSRGMEMSDRQAAYCCTSSKALGVIRIPDLFAPLAAARPAVGPRRQRVARVSGALHFLASYVPLGSPSDGAEQHEAAIGYRLGVLEKKLVNWLFQHLASRSGVQRPHLALVTVVAVFPFLSGFDPEARRSFVERAIERYAAGCLALFDDAVVLLANDARYAHFCELATADEVRCAAGIEAALSSAAAHCVGRPLSGLASAATEVMQRIITAGSSEAAFPVLSMHFAVTLQVLAPLVMANPKKSVNWSAPVMRVAASVLQDADPVVKALFRQQLERRRPDFTATDIWLAGLSALTRRAASVGRPVSDDGHRTADVEAGLALPSALLGNEASAFFSILPSAEPTDESVEDAVRHGTAGAAAAAHRAPVAVVRLRGPPHAPTLVADGAVPQRAREVSAPSANPDPRILNAICGGWARSGLVLAPGLASRCQSKPGSDSGVLVIAVPKAGKHRRSRRPRDAADAGDDMWAPENNGDEGVRPATARRRRRE